MTTLCGWLGPAKTEDASAVLQAMAGAPGTQAAGAAKGAWEVGSNFGLAIKGPAVTTALAREGELVAAIDGYPKWSDPAIAAIAKARGHGFALIAAYRAKGAELLAGLRGAFVLALIDLGAGRALSAIDRFGIGTMCYAQPRADLLVFGTTTDAVRAHPNVGATISAQSVFDYLYFVDRVPAPATIYREQKKLAPAERLVFEKGRALVSTYWQMPYRAEAPVDQGEAAEELRQRLRTAVGGALEGEDRDRVGAFLSGGLDSTSVIGLANDLLGGALKTFTIGFPIARFDETHYAELAAKHFRTRHETYYLRPEDVPETLIKSIAAYDEPFGNSSLVPAYHCARLAREAGVEMMLAGDGGDEIFAGNQRYVSDQRYDRYAQLPALIRRGVIEPAARMLAWGNGVGPLGRPLRYVDWARRSVPERMADNVFRALAPGELLRPEALEEIDREFARGLASLVYDAPKGASKVQRMMHLDLRITLADSDLRKVARMCALAGVRVRFPFLDDDLVEFSTRLPESLLVEGGRLRGFYKRAMQGFLPDEILNKTKHGFGLPYLDFMNASAPLRDLVCDSLSALKARPYFRADFLEKLIARARAGKMSGHETVAWDLIVLELWLQQRSCDNAACSG
jgi:asparagine synthase (glutamine-hydrolysing)